MSLTTNEKGHASDHYGPRAEEKYGLDNKRIREDGADILKYAVIMIRNNKLYVAYRVNNRLRKTRPSGLTEYHLEDGQANTEDQINYVIATLLSGCDSHSFHCSNLI